MSCQKKLPAAVLEAIEERRAHAYELRCLIECVQAADAATTHGVQVNDFEAALRGLVTFADRLAESLDDEAFADDVAAIEGRTASEAAVEARGEAEEAAERRAEPRKLRVVTAAKSGQEAEQ